MPDERADMPAVRQLRPCLAVVLSATTCVLLSACGGGRAHSPGDTTSTVSGVAHDAASTVSSAGVQHASPVPSRTQALAFAHAVNLSVGDIPEASVEASRAHSSGADGGAAARTCETLKGWGRSHAIAEASSRKLRRGQELEVEQITSSVSILHDEQAVARQFALLSSRALRECAARALTHSLDDRPIRNAKWGRVTISKLPVSAPGTTAKVGIRIVATLNLSFSEVSVPIYVDVFGFSLGRAEVAFTAMSVTQPVPSSTEQELLSLLLARARRQPL
jgi:hypothetical protein